MHVNGTAHQQFLNAALPLTLASLVNPLPGIVDTAIPAHLGAADFSSAVAAGSAVIGLIIWSFSFFRKVTDKQTQFVMDRLNNRPRKTRGGKSPNELFKGQRVGLLTA